MGRGRRAYRYCGVWASRIGKNHTHQIFVKLHTRHSLKTCAGPITIISGKDKRLTLIECPDDACALIDLCRSLI